MSRHRVFIDQFVINSRIIPPKIPAQLHCEPKGRRFPFLTSPSMSWDPAQHFSLQESPSPLEAASGGAPRGWMLGWGAKPYGTGRGCSAFAAQCNYRISSTFCIRPVGPCQGSAVAGSPPSPWAIRAQRRFSLTHGACSEISCPHLSLEPRVRRGGRRKAALAHPKCLL